MGPLPMNAGDSYRQRAAELKAKAAHEPNVTLAAEWEHLALSYLRLAEQADSNSYQDLWVEIGSPIRLVRDGDGK